MKAAWKFWAPVCGVLALAVSSVPGAMAQCSIFTPGAIHPNLKSGSVAPAVVRELTHSVGPAAEAVVGNAPVVGFWHVHFFSNGITSGIPGGIPYGAEVDAGYSQWHSDGTEIMNSAGRAPDTGAFCLGTWAKIGAREYKLNHFAAAWDPTKGADGLVGPANIKEDVTVSNDGSKFSGTFSIDIYGEDNTLLQHLEGWITGTRITVDTPPSSIF